VTLFGMDAGAHRLVNVMLHLANVLLFFFLLRAATGKVPESLFAAALFAVHPLHVESVAWVTERKDVLFALFWLLAIAAYRRYAVRPSVSRYAAVAALFLASLLSKPAAVTLPFVFLLLDCWPLGRFRFGKEPACDSPLALEPVAGRSLLLEKVPFLAVSAAVSVVTYRLQDRIEAVFDIPAAARIGNAVAAYGAYLRKAAWPADLAVFYPLGPGGPAWGKVALSGLLLVGVTAAVFRRAASRKWLPVGWCWFLGTLVPVIGLVQAGSKGMADRCVYVPMMGIYLAAALGLSEIASATRIPRRAAAALASIAVAALACCGIVQAGYWKDSETLFRHALSVTGDNWLAHAYLGNLAQQAGRDGEAMAHLREAIRIEPRLPDVRYGIAKIQERQGALDEAERSYREELAISPGSAETLAGLAGVLARQGRSDEAQARYAEALRIRPGDPDAHNGLGVLLAARGRIPDAIGHYRAALEAAPENADARFNLAVALSASGRDDEAMRQLEASLRIAPDNPEAQNNLGALHARRGEYEAAAGRFREALRLNPGYEGARRNLARALSDMASGKAR
jgi:tetratricopeptide (TPR) repeat protein